MGICLERSPETVVSLLAVLKAGGAYVPLDPRYPAERLAFMLGDAGVQALVTTSALAARLPEHGGETVLLDVEAEEIARESGDALSVAVDPENAAYVIYTSGSTGTPKGVAVTHRNVVRLVRGAQYARFAADETFLQLAPVAFDASTFEIWGALLNGACLAVAPPHTLSVEELGTVIERHGVTTLWLTAGLFHQVVDAALPALAGMRQLLAGGDVLSPEHVRRVREAYPALRLVNGYGPTENTTFTCCHIVSGEVGASVPIGRPIANTRAYVLDAELHPAPVGVPGELYAAGDGVARGYLGRPELTAERFVPDPFSRTPGARMYRTGDRVRWRADGSIEFLGRIDQQVKVRGFRIEPGEIEAALLRLPGVREAVVMAREDVPGDRRLVAYFVAEGEMPDAPALRAALREWLPEHMVPSAFVALDALPLTANGKVDRRALPAPETASPREGATAPRTPTEELLAGIWTEVLGTEVGVHDGFFDLGGHSLLATQVVSRVRQLFGAELPLRALFEASTVAELAPRVEAALRDRPGDGAPPLLPLPRDGRPLPLSFAQERLWFLSQLEAESALYSVPGALRLTGPLDVAALERTLEELVRRHESLRTTFVFRDGVPGQVVADATRPALPLDDLSALPPEEREAEARRRVNDEARRPFDLVRGPLFRARLLRLAPEEHVLVLVMHHVVSDGWSLGVLFREVGALYAALAAGEEPRLPELPVQYADFAAWQRAWLGGGVLSGQLAYWRERLADAPAVLELPTDRPRRAVYRYVGAQETRLLPAALADRLRELSRREGATLFMTLLGAFQLLLTRYSGQEDLVVGTPIAGRTQAEVEGLIGFFINTLVLRTDLSGDPGFTELLARVRETTLGAYAHQDVPFERLVEELQPERSLSYTPLFQVMFALQNIPGLSFRLPGLTLDSVEVDTGTNKFDLTLFAQEIPEGIHLVLGHSSDLFDRATAARMLEQLELLLEGITAAPERRISELPLLREAERQVVLEEWNRTEAEFPRHLTLHELVEAQARRTPDAVALRFEGRSVTYRELDERASRLAHHLRGRGVRPEARVGICLERGVEMIAGVLGILKVGGVYVPVDPAFPRERVAFTLENSAVALVLTTSGLLDTLAHVRVEALALDREWARIEREPATPPESGAHPEGLAYVLYTSGSTGRPKGVMAEHRGMCNLVTYQARTFGCGPGERVLHWAPLHFDASAAEIFMALTTGATLVLARRETLLPGPELVRLLEEERVTNAKFTPSALAAIPDAALPDLRAVLAGGEACTRELVDRWGPGRRFFNVYGPTENSVRIAVAECFPGEERIPPIGPALANVRAYVLDRHLEPVPAGVPGELYSAGVGLARGYLDRPDLTAERFLPDPFSPTPGGRMYRTGDRVRWRADGQMEFLGRFDFQVKIRGFRIEPGEVESVLRRHPAVRDAVVLAREEAPGGLRLVGYVARAEGESPTPAELRAWLKEQLPEYMVPSALVVLDAFPLNPSGKLDRRALPAPGREVDEGFVAPRTALQEAIAAVWREVLRVERVGINENFFEIGGHSLLLIQLHARLKEALRREIAVVDLFRFSTVRSLAEHLEPEGDRPPPEPAGRDRAAMRKSLLRRRG